LVVDVLDGPDEPIQAHFGRVNAYVTAARKAGGTVLVHCHGGVSRAAALVLAYLIGEEGLSYTTAWERLRKARPVVAPNDGFVQQLRAFEKLT
jgi:protein-tyrosine phosphatase